MREQFSNTRSLRYISIAEAIFIAYLIGLFIYFLANANQGSDITLTPPITFSSPVVTSPNNSNIQQPANTSSQSRSNLDSI